MKHRNNWIYDLYIRIDAEQIITGVRTNEYRKEISWAYRLGFLNQAEYENLMEYLEARAEETQNAHEHAHQVHIAQIAYEQEELLKSIEYRTHVINLFRNGIKYKGGRYQVVYRTLEEVENARKERYNSIKG